MTQDYEQEDIDEAILAAYLFGTLMDYRGVGYRSSPGKIPAIKTAREYMGIGIQEAKDYVEQLCEGKESVNSWPYSQNP
jgi:hypothetical protein